jgi:hypothetical protein
MTRPSLEASLSSRLRRVPGVPRLPWHGRPSRATPAGVVEAPVRLWMRTLDLRASRPARCLPRKAGPVTHARVSPDATRARREHPSFQPQVEREPKCPRSRTRWRPRRSARFRSASRTRPLLISGGASRRRVGPTGRPSPISRRAPNSRRCDSSSATGAPTTTGANSRPGSTRCRSSRRRSTASTSTSSTSARATRTHCR